MRTKKVTKRRLAQIIPKFYILASGTFIDAEFFAKTDGQCRAQLRRLHNIHRMERGRHKNPSRLSVQVIRLRQ